MFIFTYLLCFAFCSCSVLASCLLAFWLIKSRRYVRTQLCTLPASLVPYRNDRCYKLCHFGIIILLLSRSPHKIIKNGFICHALGKIETMWVPNRLRILNRIAFGEHAKTAKRFVMLQTKSNQTTNHKAHLPIKINAFYLPNDNKEHTMDRIDCSTMLEYEGLNLFHPIMSHKGGPFQPLSNLQNRSYHTFYPTNDDDF